MTKAISYNINPNAKYDVFFLEITPFSVSLHEDYDFVQYYLESK
jgi:hypothetical protein